MREQLFDNVDYRIDPLWIVKSYFNAIEGISFPTALNYLLEDTSYGSEYAMCEFPSEDADGIFDGVRFSFLDKDEIIVSQEIFKKYLKIAAERYIELNTEKADEVQNVLKKLSE
ncbi:MULTISPECIES: ribonuclease toxin immunity protein CdiI [unclassified Nostoc]|uniref:ribonuclease toxin immunity protein CdiI n=1 Tax=unclassified Nostoc TaxID=2593658 RepID=UPI002625CD80|nr:ribonuclease toxin immunity protein CdiI [Nostoc sp. S13]MDF5734547.1 ribonuclease toxin immunity protein CdiI [Nostoc sp. S13]